MTISDDLFQLIKSMSKAEKGYFKKMANRNVRGEKNNYVRLFEAIDKQKGYDEAKILKKLRNHAFAQRLSTEKNYLYKLILKSLNGYYAEKSADAAVREQIGYIKTLRDKKLMDLAFKQIKKTKKLAYKYEFYDYLVKIIGIEASLFLVCVPAQAEELEQAYLTEKRTLLEKLKILTDYEELYMQVAWLQEKSASIKRKQQRQRAQEFLDNPLLNGEQKAIDAFPIQLLYYASLSISYELVGNLPKAYQAAKSCTDLWEQAPHFIKEYPSRYRNTLQGLAFKCYYMQKAKVLKNTIEKLRQLPMVSTFDEVQIFEMTYGLELAFYFMVGDFGVFKNVLERLKNKLTHYGELVRPTSRLTFYYNLAFGAFVFEQYAEALDWINRYFDLKGKETRDDIYYKALWLNLLIHYELGNLNLLESLHRAAYRYLHKKQTIYRFERALLQLLKKLLNVVSKKQKKQLFLDFEDELNTIAEEKSELQAMYATEIRTWVKSHILDKSFSEVYEMRSVEGT